MERKQITYDDFMSYTQIKPGIVHIHQGMIYKNSPYTESLVEEIEQVSAHPVFSQITLPLYSLYCQEMYFGYVYRFNNNLRQVADAIYLKLVKGEEQFALELISLVEKLNSINMCYWDFHRNNVFSDQNGHPFLIDIDDMKANPSSLHKFHQAKYLTEYLMNLYFDDDKTVSEYYKNPTIQSYFRDETIKYLDSLNRRTGAVVELPYRIIDELSNPIKRELIKSRIK